MHWCEHHLINKGRALTANGNEALIDSTVKLSPSIHELKTVGTRESPWSPWTPCSR